MKAEQFFEDWKDTLATAGRNATSHYVNGKLAGMGSAAAAARVSLRKDTDLLVRGWLGWLARQNFGPNKRAGDADDFRQYIKLKFGQPTLDQLEPTIDKLTASTTDPALAPVPPGNAQAPAPAMPQPQAPTPVTPQPQVAPQPPRQAPMNKFVANNIAIPQPPVPGLRPAPVPTGTPVVPPRRRSQPQAPANSEVPDFLRRQKNQESAEARHDMMSRIVEVLQIASPGQRADMIAQIHHLQANPMIMARFPELASRLNEDGPALNRSVIDQIMRQLAINQHDENGGPAHQAQPSTQRNAQTTATAASQPQNQRQSQQTPPVRFDPDRIMQSQITIDGLTKALRSRRVTLPSRDENAITSALNRHNGSMTMAELVSEIHVVDATTLPALLFALANS